MLVKMTLYVLLTCSPNNGIAKQKAGPTVEHGKTQDAPSSKMLPLLYLRPLKPQKNLEQFVTEHGELRFRRATKRPTSGQPFDSNDDAVKAAQNFLRENFGDFPGDIYLRSPVQQRKAGTDPNDPDRIVYLGIRFDGIPLEGVGAIFNFRGKDIVLATFTLATIEPVPDSKRPIITRAEAFAALKGKIPDEWLQHFRSAELSLEYAWTIWDNEKLDADRQNEGVSILRPNWQVGRSGLMIDAFDGRPWRDD